MTFRGVSLEARWAVAAPALFLENLTLVSPGFSLGSDLGCGHLPSIDVIQINVRQRNQLLDSKQ